MTSFCLKSGPEEPAGWAGEGKEGRRSRQYTTCVRISKCFSPASSPPEL